MHIVVVLAGLARAAPPWKILPDTDWPNNAPGGKQCEVKASNASTCGDACFGMRNCVSFITRLFDIVVLFISVYLI